MTEYKQRQSAHASCRSRTRPCRRGRAGRQLCSVSCARAICCSSRDSCRSAPMASIPPHQGKLGAAVSLEAGQSAARQAALNVLAQANAAVGDLARNCAPCASAAMSTARPTSVAAAGRQRRFRSRRRRAGREWQTCALRRGRRAIAARRRCRSRRHLRDSSVNVPRFRMADGAADRPSRPA